ncbi:MAG: DUF2341 domain-containing protein, partial [Candidatus Thorarchaeota archaeon]
MRHLGKLLSIIIILAFIPTLASVYIENTTSNSVEAESLNESVQAAGEEWLEGWPYRKMHTILRSSGAGTDYQVEIEIHSGYGTDSGNDVYLPSDHWSTSWPVRFTDDNGVTLLDYWKESSTGFSAIYWVKISDSLDSDATICIYYGNSTASSLSNGTATFLFFDDFESGDFGNWDSAGSEWSVDAANKKYGSYSAKGNSTGAPSSLLLKTQTISQNCLFHVWFYVESSGTQLTYPLSVRDGDGDDVLMLTDYGFNQLRHLNGVIAELWPSYNTYTDATWFRLELAYDFGGSMAYAWNDRQAMGSALLGDYPEGGPVSSISAFRPHTASVAKLMYMDDYYVRKWIAAEPTHGDWGLEEERAGMVNWYHGCSNLDGFTGVGDSTWPRYPTTEVTVGTLASTGGYIYATDYGTGTDQYGPLRFVTLDYPVEVGRFVSLEAEIEIDSTQINRRGEIAISLHDETNKTIGAVIVHDRWVSQDDVSAFGVWEFSNYSIRSSPTSHPTYATNQSYRDTIRLYQNATGIFVNAPRIGEFKITDSADLKPHRKIHYLSLQLQSWDDGFGTDICETMRVHHIEFSWNRTGRVEEPELFTWHDACTSTNGWIYGIGYWDGWNPWGLATGTLASESGYLRTQTNDGSSTGPFWFKSLDTAANLSDLYDFSVDVQMVPIDPNDRGGFAAILYDQNKLPIIRYSFMDWTQSEYDIDLAAIYRFGNGTSVSFNLENVTSTDWRGVVRTYRSSSGGLRAEISGGGSSELLSAADVANEADRKVSYVGIQWRGVPTWYLNSRLYDIAMQTTGTLIGPTITLETPLNNTIHSSGTLVNLSITDPSGISHVTYRWDDGNNQPLAYPYATSLPVGDSLHTLIV